MPKPNNNKDQHSIGGSINDGILDIGISGGVIGGSISYDLEEQQVVGGSVNADILRAINIEVGQYRCTQFITITLSDPSGLLSTSWTVERELPGCEDEDDDNDKDYEDHSNDRDYERIEPVINEPPPEWIGTSTVFIVDWTYDDLTIDYGIRKVGDKWDVIETNRYLAQWRHQYRVRVHDCNPYAKWQIAQGSYKEFYGYSSIPDGENQYEYGGGYIAGKDTEILEWWQEKLDVDTYQFSWQKVSIDVARVKWDGIQPASDFSLSDANENGFKPVYFFQQERNQLKFNYIDDDYYGLYGTYPEQLLFRANTSIKITPEDIPLLERPPDIEYPKMKKKCCKDKEDKRILKYLKEIHEVLDPKGIKKSSIPKRFLYLDGKGKHEMKNYGDILEAIIRMLDFKGFVPFSVETKADESGKALSLNYIHQSQAYQHILSLLLDTEKDVDSNKDAIARLILLCSQNTLTSIETNKAVASIVEYLGFETKDRAMNVRLPVNPLFSIELDPEDEEINDKALAALSQDSEQKLSYVENVQSKGLQAQIFDLLSKITKPSNLKELTR